MLRVVTHPDGVDAGVLAASAEGLLPDGAERLEDVVPGNDRLTAAEQLHIYAFAYFDRIIEVLAGELPAVQHLLGEDVFFEEMKRYLGEHPSSTWTLDRVGASMAEWLARRADEVEDGARWRVAVDIARVERAMDAVWDEPFAGPVTYEALASFPHDRWPDARLRTIPALRLLSLQHPVTALMNAARDGEDTELPEPEPAWMCVYRDDAKRWRFPLDREQHCLLAALHRGHTLGAAIGEVAQLDGTDIGALMGSLGEWFREWMGSGLFSSVQLESDD